MTARVYDASGDKIKHSGFQFDYKGYIISCSFVLQDWADIAVMKVDDGSFFQNGFVSVEEAIKVVDSYDC